MIRVPLGLSLIFCLFTSSLGSWEVANIGFGLKGKQFPLYSPLEQYNIFENDASFPWGQFLPMVAIRDRCGNSDQNITGKIAVVSFEGGASSKCSNGDIQARLAPEKPIAILFTTIVGSQHAWGVDPMSRLSNDLAIFYTGYTDPYTIHLNDPAFLVESGGDVAAFSANVPNVTMRLSRPNRNPQLNALFLPGPYQAAIYISISVGLLLMMFCVWKLSAFYHIIGKLQLSIPIVVIALMFLTAFWVFLVGGILGGVRTTTAVQAQDVSEFLHAVTFGWLYTGIMILGFYFGEVATLTSAQSVPGLDKLRIPAGIWILVVWAVVLAAGGVQAADSDTDLSRGGRTGLQVFFFVMLAIVLPIFAMLPMIWGSFTLVRQIGSSPSHRSTIIRIVGITILLFAILLSVLLYMWLLRWNPGGFAIPTWATEFSYSYAFDLFYTLGIYACVFIIVLSFSVSVDQEIEVSKSGTSSTSSGSSKGSSSSSSSSSADPVIEL